MRALIRVYKKVKKILLSFIVATTLLTACKEDSKDPEPQEKKYAKVRLKVEHQFNGATVDLDSEFINENGDTIQFSEIKYYLSNLVFMDSLMNHQKDEDVYHLIEVTNESNVIDVLIDGFDAGVYESFKISVGVDSVANHSFADAKGDLDPNGADGMIWSWNTGYKFVKLEGAYGTPDTSGNFAYHIGGDANYKTFEFGTSSHDHTENVTRESSEGLYISLEEDKVTEIHLVVDLAEVFKSPNTIDIAVTNKAHGASGGTLMDNIVTSEDDDKNGWFELHHLTTMDH